MTKTNHKSKSAVPVVLGIDLAKNTVHVHAVDDKGRTCFSRKMSRAKLKTMLSNLSPCLVGLEACGRAHWWSREIQALGHDARLMAPQFVKPFVKSNKNDRKSQAWDFRSNAIYGPPPFCKSNFSYGRVGCSHLSDLFVRDFCPLAPMEFAPVRPYQVVDFNYLSLWHFQVFTPAGLPFLPSRLITLKQPGG